MLAIKKQTKNEQMFKDPKPKEHQELFYKKKLRRIGKIAKVSLEKNII